MSTTLAGELLPSRILSLPEEVLELVCVQVEGSEDTVTATRTLLTWINTCRAFVSSGQRALYRAPFRCDTFLFSPAGPLSLQHTLTEQPRLAGYIRDLRAFGHAMIVLKHNLRGVLPTDEPAFDVAAFHHSILGMAKNCKTLGLAVLSPECAPKLGELVAKHPSASRLVFSFSHKISEQPSVRTFLRAYKQAKGSSRLWDGIGLDIRAGHKLSSSTKPLPFRTPSLSLNLRYLQGKYWAPFVPRHPEHLRTLSITSHLYEGPDDLLRFANQLAHARGLSSFSFTGGPIVRQLQSTEAYENLPDDYGTSFPLAIFQAFPRLRHLSLRNTSNMTLEKLSLVADSCPRMHHLSLRNSYWSTSSSAFIAADFLGPRNSFTKGEKKLFDIIQRFPNLRYIHLGVLPVDPNGSNRPLMILSAVCSVRKVTLRWEGCVVTEEEGEGAAVDGSAGDGTDEDDEEGDEGDSEDEENDKSE